jgi:hypothetical protein
VLRPITLLLAAVGLVIAAISTGQAGLAWGSVVLTLAAAVMSLLSWRRSWLRRREISQEQDISDGPLDPTPDGCRAQSPPVSPGQCPDPPAGTTLDGDPCGTEPGEEDTDAADLLLVYELSDEVLVVDEHPRYHLAHCRWLEHDRAERVPVREARELGFTPCARCRPDTTLARKHRAARNASGAAKPACTSLTPPRYPGVTGTDPAITGEPPEERDALQP